MLRGVSTSSTSCRFHCPTNCTNSGSLVLGAQIVHSNGNDGKLALSLKKTNKQTNKHKQIFTFPPLLFAHYWAYIHPTSSTHRSFTDLPLIDPTSIPDGPNLHRPYILLSFQDNLFVMIPALNSEAVHHHQISNVYPPRSPPHFYCFPSPTPPQPPPHLNCFPCPSLSPRFYCFSSKTAPTL